ncbi:MAG TPA: hypothetical protein VIL99_11155 [Ignavibacteria bacterium]
MAKNPLLLLFAPTYYKTEIFSSLKPILTMSHYQMKTSSLDHIKPNTLFAAKSMTANGVTV